MKALHRVVQGIFKAAGTFGDSRLTSRGGRCISFGHCAVNFLCGGFHDQRRGAVRETPRSKRTESCGTVCTLENIFV